MKLTARLSAVLTALLSAACFSGAVRGLTVLRGLADPAQYRDARGFALFWGFLGCVFLAIAVLSWRSVPAKEA